MNNKSQLVIFDKGRWRIRLAPSATSDEVVAFAASELRRYLARLAGASLPGNRADRQAVPLILELDSNSHLPHDAFTITVTAQAVELRGTTGRGVLYAVYALLEELGCLWTYPTAAEEIVPRRKRLELKPGQRTEIPAIAQRGLGLYGLYADTLALGRDMLDWMAKNRLNLVLTSADRQDEPTRTQAMHWPEVAAALLPELRRRGIILEHSEHMTHLFFPPALFKQHPEWFALIAGKRQCRQMCFANSDAVAYFAKRLAEYAKAHPEAQILGTWPLDGGGYCECKACQKPDIAFRAIRRVAEAVQKARADLTVEYLAYTPQTLPVPKATPPLSNMSALVCDRLDDLAREWVRHMQGARGACYFEYNLGDNYRWKANVWLRPEAAVQTAHAISAIGYHGVISLFLPIRNWWRSAFNTWFFARACWQHDLDVNHELDLYCARYFGDVACHLPGDVARHLPRDVTPAMRPLLNRILHRLQDPVLQQAYHGIASPGSSPKKAKRGEIRRAMLRMARESAALQKDLKKLERRSASASIRLNIRRWRAYVEYFAAYYPTRSAKNLPRPLPGTPIPQELFRWLKSQPTELAAVNTPPEFLEWRFDKFTAWGG